MNSLEKENFRFHSLDALRFFAFFLVFLKHISGALPRTGYLSGLRLFLDGSSFEFFFVLAGFIFTFLLIKEKNKQHKFSFKKFYLKRILTTWPMFFLVVGTSYAFLYGSIYFLGDEDGFKWLQKIGLIQGEGYWPSWKHSFLFLENYKMWEHNLLLHEYKEWFPMLGSLVVTWFICVQEHFYFFWPMLILFVPNKYLLRVLFACILFSIMLKLGICYVFQERSLRSLQVDHDFFTYLDLYSIGGVLGYFTFYNYQKIVDFNLRIPNFAKLAYFAFVLFFLKFYHLFNVYSVFSKLIWNSVIGLVFVLLLLFFIPSDSKIKFTERSVFSKLGKMSYSLYLLHLIVIHLTLRFFDANEIQITSIFNLTLFLLITMLGSLAVSLVTYNFVEKPFLRLKSKIA